MRWITTLLNWMDTVLRRNKSDNPRHEALRLVENVSGNWSYHLAQGPRSKALCDSDKRVMFSPAPLTTWGYRGDQNERYCRECERIAIVQDMGLPHSVRHTH